MARKGNGACGIGGVWWVGWGVGSVALGRGGRGVLQFLQAVGLRHTVDAMDVSQRDLWE